MNVILPNRMKHKVANSPRHSVLLDEIQTRTCQITSVYANMLKTEIYENPSLVKAAAHWLKFESDEFYEESEAQHKHLGIDFIWGGIEKAVGFTTPDKNGEDAYYVLIMSDDLFIEENIAQYAGGIFSKDEIDRRSIEIRRQMDKLHATPYFCILNPVKKDTA